MILKNNNTELPKGISPNFITEPAPLQSKATKILDVTYQESIKPDEGYSGMSSLTISYDPQPKLGPISIEPHENGSNTYSSKSYLGPEYDGFSSASIDTTHIEYNLQDLEIEISADASIYPDPEFEGLGRVTIKDTVPLPTDLDGMKYNGSVFTNFPDTWHFATRTGTNANQMFANCEALRKITNPITFDDSATQAQQIFYKCTNLTSFPTLINTPRDITRAFNNSGVLHPNPNNTFERVEIGTNAFSSSSIQEIIKTPNLVNGTEMYAGSKLRCIMPVLDLNRDPNTYTKQDLHLDFSKVTTSPYMFDQTQLGSFYGSIDGAVESDKDNAVAYRKLFVDIVENIYKQQDKTFWGLDLSNSVNTSQLMNSHNFTGLIPFDSHEYDTIKDNLDYWDDFMDKLNETGYAWDVSKSTNCTNIALGVINKAFFMLPNIKMNSATSLGNIARGGALIMGGLEGLTASFALDSYQPPTKRSLERVIKSLGDATSHATKPILTIKKTAYDPIDDVYKTMLVDKGWEVKII